MLRFSSVCLLLFLPLALGARGIWKQEGNGRLELSTLDTTLVRFVLNAAPKDPHFEVLATADGRNAVWVGPQDHPWHYGLWFSWKKINGINFWEANRQTGLQEGHNEIVEPRIISHPEAEDAIVRYRELAYPDRGGPPVLEDAVKIRITRPRDGIGPVVEWNVTTTALEDVVLDRTPIPGEPEGKDWGGYAGFSWRGAQGFVDLHFMDAASRRDEAGVHQQTSPWVRASGMLDGESAGIFIMPHPSNPRQPSSWYIFNRYLARQQAPMIYANPALLMPGPITLGKGESITHRYLVIVHDGGWTPEQCEKQAQQFSESF